jgi:hypothetical protein
MSHSQSSSDDKPTEDLDIIYYGDSQHGFYGIIQHKFRAPERRDIPVEDQMTAAYRYWISKYCGTSLTDWQARVIKHVLALHDKDPEAFRRERLNKWTSDESDEPEPDADGNMPTDEPPYWAPPDPASVRRKLAKGVGIYNQMIHRNPDGSDPLVEEPGP